MVRCHSSLLLVSADRTKDDLAFGIKYLGLTFHSKDHRELFFPFPDEKRALINFVS